MRKLSTSDIENKLTNPTATANRLQEEIQKRIDENIKFNESILKDSKDFSNMEIIDGNILVRCLKYTGEQQNEGALLERKYQSFTTQGGKPGSKVEDWNWSPKGIILKMPPQWYIDSITSPEVKAKYESLKEGDEIWVHLSMFMSTNYLFIPERNFPVEANEGYFSVPISSVQMKVKS